MKRIFTVVSLMAASALAAPPAPKAMAVGKYKCWANGQARMLMNFEARSATQYVGSDGKAAAYRYDPASGKITFQGGALDGVMPTGFFAIYHEPKGHPTVSFQSPRGSEAAFCELIK